nr:furin-like isoform X2 [Crassostrea gigas]
MKIVEAWESGYTGRGVTIGIVDNGVDINHPDLKANIKNGLSYDFMDNDHDPSPSSPSVNHGTLCAGTAAAVCNNTLCGCGIAYNAFIAGIKNNDGGTYSDIEAKSLVYKMNQIAIYSNSWGESDDTNFGGPDNIVQEALSRGVKLGRSSKGSIYVWASGNSGTNDNCNADGYVTSIYTIAIASVSRGGYSASYGETCSAILASTYTDIVTTDTNGGCNKKFTGTSASAPIASAIYSLALQANERLTWRDIQHLTVETSSMTGLINIDTMENGVRRNVSHYFGFGIMSAEAMINAAKNWTLVSKQIECTESGTDTSLTIGASREVVSNINTTLCGDKIERLEHVEAHITFECTRRGEVELFLTSAQGTQSKLLTKRRKDISSATSFSWKFMSVHYWGETPSGIWSLKMRVKDASLAGILTKWKLVFFGTKENKNINKKDDKSLSLGFAKEVNTASQGGKSFIYIVVGAAILCIPIGVGICFVYCREKNKQRITPVKKESSCPVKKESS